MEIKNLKKFFLTKKNSEILIIAGKKSYNKISGEKLLRKNLSKDTKVHYYFKNSKNPELSELKIIVEKIKKIQPSLIIAIGGGCAMDYAKSANVLALEKNMNFKKEFSESFCNLLCIPTTAGTGSETTPFAVLYVNNKKTSVVGPALKADFFYFEPKFIKYNNNYTIASAGFDSLSQSMESILSKNANINSIRFAKKSIKLVLSNLIKFYKKKKRNKC